MPAFPSPSGGASLLLSFRLELKIVLIVGSGPLAASRAFAALEAGASVVIFAKGGQDAACEELKWRADQGQLSIFDLDTYSRPPVNPIDSYLSDHTNVFFVCVTDTILDPTASPESRRTAAQTIFQLCRSHRVPVNVTDMPELCDFSFASTHRFLDPATGERTALQVGVTTNGRGCRLAGRLRRDIVALLPREAGAAVEKIGAMRALARVGGGSDHVFVDDESAEDSAVSTPNRPVPPWTPSSAAAESALERARRRMKWVAQVSEYWPVERLARMSAVEMQEVLSADPDKDSQASCSAAPPPRSLHSLDMTPERRGRIILAGSGPGLPSLLTMAAHTALTGHAQVVLSDKLVPAAVLAMIPSHVDVRIARKFPGNADGAQEEMMEAAVEAAKRGLVVLRLKQGDPTVYGRVGEEILYFRARGFEPTVIPGVSSALAGPAFAGISVTQRGAAESFAVCTGVGRKGRETRLPAYERGRTVVLLMGVARLGAVVSSLLAPRACDDGGGGYPPHTPIALIERASMPDQRVIESTLRDIEAALESVGEQRPPGLLVVGWTVPALWCAGDVDVLDGEAGRDEERVRAWLGGDAAGRVRWRVREGLPDGWRDQ